MEIDKNFSEFIKLLNEHNVQFLIVGGYAVNFHGYPRYTKDIDFWIWMNRENINKLISALTDFGFGTLQFNEDDFYNPENVIQLGYEPYRIDLLVDVRGMDFKACFERGEKVELEKISFKYLGIDDLIFAKKAAGRLQDLADAEQLEKIKKKKLDS